MSCHFTPLAHSLDDRVYKNPDLTEILHNFQLIHDADFYYTRMDLNDGIGSVSNNITHLQSESLSVSFHPSRVY